jgi:Putative transposase of IS4/5 family (DUF4096)
VLYTGIRWEFLPQEPGFGSGMTRWRRLRDWNEAGAWKKIRDDIHNAFITLGCAIICWRRRRNHSIC